MYSVLHYSIPWCMCHKVSYVTHVSEYLPCELLSVSVEGMSYTYYCVNVLWERGLMACTADCIATCHHESLLVAIYYFAVMRYNDE